MLEDLLADMKQDVSRLLNLLPRLPSVSLRLQLSHTGLIGKLTQQINAAKLAKQQQHISAEATVNVANGSSGQPHKSAPGKESNLCPQISATPSPSSGGACDTPST